jgi:hypothetical protein
LCRFGKYEKFPASIQPAAAAKSGVPGDSETSAAAVGDPVMGLAATWMSSLSNDCKTGVDMTVKHVTLTGVQWLYLPSRNYSET